VFCLKGEACLPASTTPFSYLNFFFASVCTHVLKNKRNILSSATLTFYHDTVKCDESPCRLGRRMAATVAHLYPAAHPGCLPHLSLPYVAVVVDLPEIAQAGAKSTL
jgi:hypothetical protein